MVYFFSGVCGCPTAASFCEAPAGPLRPCSGSPFLRRREECPRSQAQVFMSTNEQFFWVWSHPLAPPYHSLRNSGFLGPSSSITAALPLGICTRFPILLRP